VINVQTNLDAFQRRCNRIMFQQFPFATARALTVIAGKMAEAEKANESKILDRPRPFTQNALGVIPANKTRQQATMFLKDITARYLDPYEFGGSNVLNSRALLKPVAAMKNLDQYGNLPRRLLAKLKARNDVFVGRIKTKRGMIDGVWQRSSAKDLANLKARGLHVVGRGYNKSDKLVLLIKFADAHPVKQHLDWFRVADATVARQFDAVFRRELALAVMNRK